MYESAVHYNLFLPLVKLFVVIVQFGGGTAVDTPY